MSGTFSNVFPTFLKAARLVRAGLLVVMLGCLAGAAFGQPGMFQIESSSQQFVVLVHLAGRDLQGVDEGVGGGFGKVDGHGRR